MYQFPQEWKYTQCCVSLLQVKEKTPVIQCMTEVQKSAIYDSPLPILIGIFIIFFKHTIQLFISAEQTF